MFFAVKAIRKVDVYIVDGTLYTKNNEAHTVFSFIEKSPKKSSLIQPET